MEDVPVAYISHAVCNKDGRCSAAFLRGACHIGHADTDDQTDHWSKESNDSIASYRCGSSMGPAATPDHCTASDYWQAADNQKNESNVGYPAGQVARKENENEADAAERELEKD